MAHGAAGRGGAQSPGGLEIGAYRAYPPGRTLTRVPDSSLKEADAIPPPEKPFTPPEPATRAESPLDRLPFGPGRPELDMISRPLFKSRIDREGLNRELRRLGETPLS